MGSKWASVFFFFIQGRIGGLCCVILHEGACYVPKSRLANRFLLEIINKVQSN